MESVVYEQIDITVEKAQSQDLGLSYKIIVRDYSHLFLGMTKSCIMLAIQGA